MVATFKQIKTISTTIHKPEYEGQVEAHKSLDSRDLCLSCYVGYQPFYRERGSIATFSGHRSRDRT